MVWSEDSIRQALDIMTEADETLNGPTVRNDPRYDGARQVAYGMRIAFEAVLEDDPGVELKSASSTHVPYLDN